MRQAGTHSADEQFGPMSTKLQIIDELAEGALLLPARINRALQANDRIKYYLSLLQAACAHADHPTHDFSDLRAERVACGETDDALDEVIPGSCAIGDDAGYTIPHAGRIHGRIVDGLREMVAPLGKAAAERRTNGEPQPDYETRLQSLLATLAAPEEDKVSAAYVDEMTRASRAKGDSPHLLVMDLHRELNRLQTLVAEESIEGASAYGLREDDRTLVRAFMAGLNSTAPLKFDHPGLGTTATRTDGDLVIQNDLGTTDAHVFVVHVNGLDATVTYTDVHAERVQFFQSLFAATKLVWEETRSRPTRLGDGDSYQLCLGRMGAKDPPELERFLSFLGSRLVFLIDWNRARKRLQNFVGKRDAIAILKWAADNNHGHRAFLQLGGEQLVFDALARLEGAPIRYGQRLDEVLGHDPAVDYLEFVMRATALGLLEGRSARLIRDEVRAELLGHFHSIEQDLLGLAADHAAVVAELAESMREALIDAGDAVHDNGVAEIARRAKTCEKKADELVTRVRDAVKRADGIEVFARLLHEADDAADHFEDAVFLLSLLPAAIQPNVLQESLRNLADLTVAGAREFVKCTETAAVVYHGGCREDVQDFLEAVDRAVTIEHQTDDVEREVTYLLIRHAEDFRMLHLLSEIAHRLEAAGDALSRSSLILRDHILSEAVSR
jgi:uncharacterized protein Yka (UPF0111/DUF47 family)